MKLFLVSVLSGLVCGVSAERSAPRRLQDIDLGLVSTWFEQGPCKTADPNGEALQQQAQWEKCKRFVANRANAVIAAQTNTTGSVRRLQSPINGDNLPSVQTGSAADFSAPCYSLPADPVAEGWLPVGQNTDDGSTAVDLGFNFKFYGQTFSSGFLQVNGILSFGANDPIGFFFSSDFPTLYEENVVAPFWADVDNRNGAGGGKIWYKKFGDHLAVIWDRVGFSNALNPTTKRNTFQAVISDGNVNGRLGESNICFCYVDMDWWRGLYVDVPANVGLSSVTDDYVQIGRFGKSGDDYDGPSGNIDGIDWLDFQGSSLRRSPEQQDPIQGMCFNTLADKNVPPVITGFPLGNTYNIACGGTLDLSITFATPEVDQTIFVTLPTNIGSIPGLRYNASVPAEIVTVDLLWAPTRDQGGTYTLKFIASDNFVPPATATRTLTIVVASCGGNPELPEKCAPINGNTCSAGDPQPLCTPYRSAEHCPLDESFPMYIKARHEMVKGDASNLSASGYWFPLLEDKAAAYMFTMSSGYHSPKMLCCGEPDSWYSLCFGGGVDPTSFVIRAVGDQHSNSAVYVLPTGFGGVELLSGNVMTAEQAQSAIAGLVSAPTKVIVEEYISGGPAQSLPNEYKVHAFNGKVGSIGMVLNRNSDCSCYAEVDTEWNRLDKYGCFVPNMPFGQVKDACFDIDFEQGALNPFPIKGQDLCSAIPVDGCVLDRVVAIAEAISAIIGVYVRIDFFIGGNGKIYIQEYTFNHNNGLRHCSAKLNDSGCIDSCFMGRMWKESGSTELELIMGGPATTIPPSLTTWDTMDPSTQCLNCLEVNATATQDTC